MLGQRLAGPRRDALDRRRRRMPVAECIGQLAPYQQFVVELFRPVAAHVGTLAGDAKRRHHAVVKIRRHAAHAVDGRVIALGRVLGEPAAALELLPARVPGVRAAARMRYRPHAVIDLALGHHRCDVGGGQCHRLVGQIRRDERCAVGLHIAPRRREALVADTCRVVAKGEGARVRLLGERHRHDARRVHAPYGAGGTVRQTIREPVEWRNGHRFGDHHARARGQPLQRRRAMSGSLEVERVADAAPRTFGLHITRTFEDESVVAIGGVRIAFAQRVVHEHGALQRAPQQQRRVERRVLVRAHRRAHPIQHELAGGRCRANGRMRRDTLGEMVGKQFGSEHAGQRAPTRSGARPVCRREARQRRCICPPFMTNFT